MSEALRASSTVFTVFPEEIYLRLPHLGTQSCIGTVQRLDELRQRSKPFLAIVARVRLFGL